jgi:hypothetical protein
MTRDANQRGKREEGSREKKNLTSSHHFIYETHRRVHTNVEPCIIASHALLLCNVVRKWSRFASGASGFDAAAAFVTEESPTAGSDGHAWGGWSNASGGVAIPGDGVGDGDIESGGVEPVECYTQQTDKAKKDIKGNTC